MNFQNEINGSGSLTLSSQTGVALNQVNMGIGSLLNLAAGNFDANGNVITAGSLAVGKLAFLVYDTMNLYGNLTVAGLLNTGYLNLLDGSGFRQVISLNGTQSFIDVDLQNAAGAQLFAGNMTVLGDFKFTGGKFAINSNNLKVWGNVVNAGMDHYFVTNGIGFLRMQVNTLTPTDFWVGSELYAGDVSITGTSNSIWFSVSSMDKVTGTGTPYSPTIYGNADTVMRTWFINSDIATTYHVGFAWDPAGQGSGFAPLNKANVFNYQGWKWVSTKDAVSIDKSGPMHSINSFTTSNTGSFTIAVPNTDFSFPGEFRGLNNSSANQNFGPGPSIEVDVPPSQGEYSFDMMQLYLSESVLGNPLDVFVPGTGTDIGGEYANDFLTITSGRSVYGTPNGENGVNTDWDYDDELLDPTGGSNPAAPDPGSEIDQQLDDFFTELADNSMHEKHPAFKSEVEILLDKLLAS